MRFFDFNKFYSNRDQEVLPEKREKTVLRPDLIVNVVPGIVQLMLENARWHPPKECDWIFVGKKMIATWEMYRIEPLTANLYSINLMPMQVPILKQCQDPNGALIWIMRKYGARSLRSYVNLRHIADTDIFALPDPGPDLLEILCLRMIKLASNFGVSAEEIDGITNVLFQ